MMILPRHNVSQRVEIITSKDLEDFHSYIDAGESGFNDLLRSKNKIEYILEDPLDQNQRANRRDDNNQLSQLQQSSDNQTTSDIKILSDLLFIDETEARKLWNASTTTGDRDRSMSQAIESFFINRDMRLSLLYKALGARNNYDSDDYSKSIAKFFFQLTNNIGNSLTKYLFDQIEKHTEKIINAQKATSFAKLCVEFLLLERKKLAQCLFVFLYGTHSTIDEVKELIHLIQKQSNEIMNQNDALSDIVRDSTFEIVRILCTTLCCAIDVHTTLLYRDKEVFGEALQLEGRTKDFLEIAESVELISPGKELANHFQGRGTNHQETWEHDGIHGFCLLCVGLYFSDADASNFSEQLSESVGEKFCNILKMSFQHRGIAFLHGMIRSSEFIGDELRMQFLNVLYDAVSRLALRVSEEDKGNTLMDIREVQNAVAQQAMQNPRSNSYALTTSGDIQYKDIDSFREDSLDDLLKLITLMNTLDPDLSYKYLDDPFWKFVVYVAKHAKKYGVSPVPESFYVTVVSFLASVATPRDNAVDLITKLSTDLTVNNLFTWDVLTQALSYFLKELTSDQNKTIPHREQFVLCKWMQWFQVSRCSDEVNDAIVSLCIQLLQLISSPRGGDDLEPAFKAQLILVVGKSARVLASRNIWDDMFQCRNANACWLRDLVKMNQDRESFMHSYPLTLSYLALIRDLMKRESKPNSEHATKTLFLGTEDAPGMLQFLEFSLQDVFLKLDQRKYYQVGEKWKMASQCLQIFVDILENYNNTSDNICYKSDFAPDETASKSYSSGFWVMTKLLEGGDFFKQILSIITNAGGAQGLQSDRSELDSAKTREDKLVSFGKLRWYLVSGRRQNLNATKSTSFRNDISQNHDMGYGMLILRQKPTAMKLDDGGRFASWLVQPSLMGWSNPALFSDAHEMNLMDAQSTIFRSYPWDNGDIRGLWHEHAVKLALKLLNLVSLRENWFLKSINSNSQRLDNRLERVHRLVSHKHTYVTSLSEYCGYPYSAEIRSTAIKLVFRLSNESGTNFVVVALRGNHESRLSSDLIGCINGTKGVGAAISSNYNPDTYDPIDYAMDAEHKENAEARDLVMRLLIQGISVQPRPNIAELVLGIDRAFGNSFSSGSQLLSEKDRSALSTLIRRVECDLVEVDSFTEQIFHLVFLICNNQSIGPSMTKALFVQRKQFWVKRFQCLIAMENWATPSPKLALSWVLRGLALNLKMFGTSHQDETKSILGALFASQNAEQKSRILEVIQRIPVDEEMMDLNLVIDSRYQKNAATVFDNFFALFDINKLPETHRQESEARILQWNTQQRNMAARLRVMDAWGDLVNVCLVNCREVWVDTNQYTEACTMLCDSIFLCLGGMAGYEWLMRPIAQCLLVLVFQISSVCRFEALQQESQTDARSSAAATGKYTMLFSTEPYLNDQDSLGVGRDSNSHRHLVENIVELLRRGRGATGEIRSLLYASFLVIVSCSRELYASKVHQLMWFAQIPCWITEHRFLQLSQNLPANDKGGADLRNRAISTLEILHGADRGRILMDLVVRDLLDSKNVATQLLSLSMLKCLIECDMQNLWINQRLSNGILRLLVTFVKNRLDVDKLNSEATQDKLFEASLAVLDSIASTREGADELICNSSVYCLMGECHALLCDKRAVEPTSQHSQNYGSKELRHQLVLPLLRFLVTLISSCQKGSAPETIGKLQRDLVTMIQVQKAMVDSVLLLLPTSIGDIQEMIMILTILRFCAESEFLTQELGAKYLSEIDTRVIGLIAQLSSPNPGELAFQGRISPSNAHEQARTQDFVKSVPELRAMGHETDHSKIQKSLFELDVFSQERRLLQHAIAYYRVRSCVQSKAAAGLPIANTSRMEINRRESFINTVIGCLDYLSRSLAAVSHSSTAAFNRAINDKTPEIGGAESEDEGYYSWTCASLLNTIESALAILYYKLPGLDKAGIEKVLADVRLFGRGDKSESSTKSALAQLEELVRESSGSRIYIHLMLRRLREQKKA